MNKIIEVPMPLAEQLKYFTQQFLTLFPGAILLEAHIYYKGNNTNRNPESVKLQFLNPVDGFKYYRYHPLDLLVQKQESES